MTIDLPADACPHGLYPASSCPRCNGRYASQRKMGNAIVDLYLRAVYATTCGRCGDDIGAGEPFDRTASGYHVCGRCAP